MSDVDDALAAAREAHRENRPGAYYDLAAAEKAHLAAREPLASEAPKRGTIALDRDGDAWKWGNTRWTCLAPVDGERILRVARLPHSAFLSEYGPARVIGDSKSWFYATIRGRS